MDRLVSMLININDIQLRIARLYLEMRIVKRAPAQVNYRIAASSALSKPEIQKALPNGYLTCKKPLQFLHDSLACQAKIKKDKNKRLMLGCGLYPKTCRFVIFINSN